MALANHLHIDEAVSTKAPLAVDLALHQIKLDHYMGYVVGEEAVRNVCLLVQVGT